MALAVRYAHFRDKQKIFWFMVITALFGATFVGMQVFEWSKLISEGVRPWANPFGAPQFGSIFFMVTGFPWGACVDWCSIPLDRRQQNQKGRL